MLKSQIKIKNRMSKRKKMYVRYSIKTRYFNSKMTALIGKLKITKAVNLINWSLAVDENRTIIQKYIN